MEYAVETTLSRCGYKLARRGDYSLGRNRKMDASDSFHIRFISAGLSAVAQTNCAKIADPGDS